MPASSCLAAPQGPSTSANPYTPRRSEDDAGPVAVGPMPIKGFPNQGEPALLAFQRLGVSCARRRSNGNATQPCPRLLHAVVRCATVAP